MKYFLFLIILTGVYSSAFAQKNKSNRDLEPVQGLQTERENLDTFYNSYAFDEIRNSQVPIHIRIRIDGQVVNLQSTDHVVYRGTLTNYVTQYRKENGKKEENNRSKYSQVLYENVSLDPQACGKVVGQFLSTGQQNIPTDDSIPGWSQRYLDCSYVGMEFKIDGNYSHQAFYCPWPQSDTIRFKKIILSNYDTMKKALKLDSLYDAFNKKLPGGIVYSKDRFMHFYKFTEKQLIDLEKTKPKLVYLKSKRRTIDSFINAEISKQKIECKGIDCFETFFLTFTKKGRLVDIDVNDPPKLGDYNYFEDAKELRKCKKLIRSVFAKIDLSTLHLEYGFYRSVSFDYLDNELHLYDNTIYYSDKE